MASKHQSIPLKSVPLKPRNWTFAIAGLQLLVKIAGLTTPEDWLLVVRSQGVLQTPCSQSFGGSPNESHGFAIALSYSFAVAGSPNCQMK